MTIPLFSEPPPRVQPEVSTIRDAAFAGIIEWINTPPLTLEDTWLYGAVFVDF